MFNVLWYLFLVSATIIFCIESVDAKALVTFGKNERLTNRNWEKQYARGEKYYAQRQWSKAIEAYLKSFKSSTPSERAKSILRVGDVYLNLKKPEIAEYSYKQSLEFCRTNEGLKHYGEFLRLHDRAKEADSLTAVRQPTVQAPGEVDPPEAISPHIQISQPFPPDIYESEKFRGK